MRARGVVRRNGKDPQLMPLDPSLLEILACPACKTPVFEADEKIYCRNGECRRCYDIFDENIPVMLIDESTVLTPEEWQKAMEKAPPEGS